MSANRSGKPLGTRHRVTRAIEELLESEHEALTRKAIEKALEGDMTALRLCLDRLPPPRKDSPISITLAAVKSIDDALQASAAVLEAVATGNITPEEAGRVMALLAAHRTIVDRRSRTANCQTGGKEMSQQTSRRLAALEAKHEEPTKLHVITCMPGESMDDGLDLHGRDLVGPNGRIISVPAPRTARDE